MIKKIAYIIPSFDEGGMARVLETLSLGLSSCEYMQYLIILIKGKKINFKANAKIVEVEHIGNNKVSKIFVFKKRIDKIKRIKEENDFDIVLSFGVTANIINILSRKNEKLILTEHSVKSIEHKIWGMYGYIYDLLIKKYYNKADTVITVSKQIKDDLVNNYKIEEKKIFTIHNGVDLKLINLMANDNVEDEIYELAKAPIIINIGSIWHAKGQWHLIRIMPYLLKFNPKIVLLILGDGADKQLLINLAKSLNIEHSVFFLGHCLNPYKYLKLATVFVMSSIYEGLPMVLCEAMALKIPIISTDCKSGPREILLKDFNLKKRIVEKTNGDYGILIPAFDGKFLDWNSPMIKNEKVMADAITELLTNKEMYDRYSDSAGIRAEVFSAENMIKAYVSIFGME